MAKSESGRVVLEMDPALKRKLYAVLALEELTLKEWFTQASKAYVKERLQVELNNFERDDNEV